MYKKLIISAAVQTGMCDKTKKNGSSNGGVLLKVIVFAVCLTSSVFSQHADWLPLITINTDGSVPIVSREEWVTMTFSMTDPQNPQNNIPALSNQQIRGRGNSSWNASWNRINPPDGINVYRNPYRIRFRNDQQQSPFGLPAARNWVLINADPERNSFGFEMGERLGLPFTCTYNPVEVYVNTGYSGKYILTEHRQADPAYSGAPGRPKVHLTEGWFVEIDRLFPLNEPLKFLTANYDLPVTIKSPSSFGDDIHDPRYDFVKRDLNELADLMASGNFPENGYRDLIDVETFAKYFLVQTFIQNIDLFRRDPATIDSTRALRDTNVIIHQIGSAFFYKDKGGKISAGPLWDLNWSFQTGQPGGPSVGSMGPNLHPYMTHPWLSRFFDDPLFLVRYKEIWNEYSDQISSMSEFVDYIYDRIHGPRRAPTAMNPNPNAARDNMISFVNTRLQFLNTEYNKVNVRPVVRSLGAIGYNYTEAPARAVTLVSYGGMTDLLASLQRGASSDFEIISQLTQTATGKGGYLAAVNVRPKGGLTTAAYRDTLILSGVKQGSAFSFRVPLDFTVTSEEYVSVLSYNRTIPQVTKPSTDTETTVPSSLSARFTAGPNPVRKSDGVIKFYASGKQLTGGTLTIYDVTGNAVRKINISDKSNRSNERRVVGEWDLKDAKGRTVTQSTYLIKGTLQTADGSREKVSLMIGVW